MKSLTILWILCSFFLLAMLARAKDEPGMLITFLSGTGKQGGQVQVRNAANGKVATKAMGPNLNRFACANILQAACTEASLKSELIKRNKDIFADTVKIYGAENKGAVTGATIEEKTFP